MEVAKRLNGIGEYYFSQKLREITEMNQRGNDVINLGIGSPDLAPHPDVIRTLHTESAKATVHGYPPYIGIHEFREAISEWYRHWYGVTLNPESEILPLIGSKEGILHICMTYLNEGDEVLIPNPGYPSYKSAVMLAGGVCVEYDLRSVQNYKPDFDLLEKSDLKKVKLMFVNYPHMPTGQLPTKDLFNQIVAFGKKHNILIIHDNPYSFILNENPMSMLSADGAKECVIELNSLSKSHNMAGWRIGMLCGAKEKISEVIRFKSNMDSGIFLPLQLAAVTALELGDDWYRDVNEIYHTRREKLYRLLDLLECTYSKNQSGLFLWASIPDVYKDGYALSDDILYKAHVFLTPGGIFGSNGEKFIRVSLCSTIEKMDEAIDRIRKFINNKSISHV